MQSLAPGTAVGPYTVESELARGGMGAVYRARRRGDGALVALKILDAGPSVTPVQQERFKREGELAARLAHPGIVRVLDAGSVSWLCYLAMDLIDGAPLGESAGRLTPLEAARLMAQVARAVEHAHAHGVVHRDLKPSNVLVRRHDGAALVTDFGIARDLGSSTLTKTGALVGTPTYFSPEQASGRPATPKSDVHALGAILFELLTGVPPFDQRELAALLVAIGKERPRRPSALSPSVPAALDRLCLAALAKSPDARPDARAFAAELEAIVAGRVERRAPRARWLLVAGVAVGALVGARLLTAKAEPEPVAVPHVATTTTRATTRPPAPPPWVEPKWLRAVRARGDTTALLEAHAALDADPTVDERSRAHALEALPALVARWTAPATLAPDRNAALEELLWLHWLWKRLDPSHALSPAHERAFTENDMWAFGTTQEKRSLMRVGRALVALMPKNVMGYLAYGSGSTLEPWTRVDGELLRLGVEVAVADGNGLAWGGLARGRASWLNDAMAHGSPEQSRSARAAILELARSCMAHGVLDSANATNFLVRGASLAGRDEAHAFLDRAEELARGPTIRSLQTRAERLAQDAVTPDDVAAAARFADRALELVLIKQNRVWIAESAVLALDLWRRAGQPSSGLATLDRALAAPGRQPGLALRRVLVLLDLPTTTAPALDSALADLVTRLVAELDAEKTPLLETALEDARAAARASSSPALVKERLARWSVDAEVRLLDPTDPPQTPR